MPDNDPLDLIDVLSDPLHLLQPLGMQKKRKSVGEQPPMPLGAFRFIVEMEKGGVVVGAFSQFSGVKLCSPRRRK